MEIRPITFREASAFIDQYHRHNRATIGCKFCLSVWNDDELIGVCVCVGDQ